VLAFPRLRILCKKSADCASQLNIYMENQSQLTMTDLASLVTIVEVACSRGAYRAAEMTLVGAVYDKLKFFIDQQNAGDAGTAAEPAATAETDPQGENHA
jgi:hypothetical protein